MKGDTTFNSGGEGLFTYVITKGELTNGVHTIKYFAEYADGDTAEPFVTPIYCRNFFVVDSDYTIGNLPLFSMSFDTFKTIGL